MSATEQSQSSNTSTETATNSSNYGGDVIFWDILFGTFHLPKGKQPSDDIGIDGMPNFPKSFVGLMFAPFVFGRLKKEAEAVNLGQEPQEEEVLAT